MARYVATKNNNRKRKAIGGFEPPPKHHCGIQASQLLKQPPKLKQQSMDIYQQSVKEYNHNKNYNIDNDESRLQWRELENNKLHKVIKLNKYRHTI